MTYGNSFKTHRKKTLNLQIVLLVFICVTALIISGAQNFNKRTENVTVTGKEVKRINKEDTYLIYGEDETGKVNVYEITDSLLHFRFNSADVYGGIKEGHEYEFKVVGYRFGLMSWYPNILEYKEIE